MVRVPCMFIYLQGVPQNKQVETSLIKMIIELLFLKLKLKIKQKGTLVNFTTYPYFDANSRLGYFK